MSQEYSDVDLPDVSGRKGGSEPPPPHVPVEAENTLQSNSVYRVLDLIGEGEIVGLVNGLKSVFINDVPLQSEDGTLNFKGFAVAGRYGIPGQTPVDGFPDGIPAYVSVGRAFSKVLGGPNALLGPYQTEILGEANLDDLRIVVSVDALYKTNAQGDTGGSSVTFRYELTAHDTSVSTFGTNTISGKCMSPYQRTLLIKAPASNTGDYTLRITRETDDFPTTGATRDHGSLTFVGYTLIRNRKLEYPDSAYILGVADARLFGSTTPKRSYHVHGLKVSVPTGYTPPEKGVNGVWSPAIYPEIWSGTLTPKVYTSNPPWCLYDIITNDRYGCGLVDTTGILKTALYPISKYCDELVDDGLGGLEPRFSLNYVINTQSEAYTLLNALVSVFRGMLWWGAGSVLVSQDSPNAGTDSVPQVLVSPANVVDGVFTYEGSGLKARHSTVSVTWNDPKDHGRPTIEYVEDRETLLRYGLRPMELVGVGCNSRGQARRVGRWALDSEKSETEIVKYRAGLDHAFVSPGMIVAVADPFYQTPAAPATGASRDELSMNRMAGRIVAATSDQIEIDGNITLTAGPTGFTIGFMSTQSTDMGLPIVVYKTVDVISTGSGIPATIIKLATPITPEEMPIPGAVWLISAQNTNPYETARLFRVVAITEDEGAYDVMALQHDPTKYARVESDLNLLPAVWDTVRPPDETAPAGNTAVTLVTRYVNNQYQNALLFSWEASADARVVEYRTEWRRSTSAEILDGTWARHAADGPNYIELYALSVGYYEFRVRAVTGTGASSVWKMATFLLEESTLPAVTNLRLINNEGELHPTNFTGADVRLAWDDGAVLEAGLAVTSYVYLIKVNDSFLYETTHLEFTYTHLMNSSDHAGTPQRDLAFSVYKKKGDGTLSLTWAGITVHNAPPSMQGFTPTITPGWSIGIDWRNWTTTDTDVTGFRLFCDEHNPPQTMVDVVGATHTQWAVPNVEGGPDYYIQILPVDAFGIGIPSNVSVKGESLALAAEVLEALTGGITETQLSQSLAEKISDTSAIQSVQTLLSSEWTVKMQEGGYVAGVGLLTYPDWAVGNSYTAGVDYVYDPLTFEVYLASATHTATEKNRPGVSPTTWALLPYGVKSEFIVRAESFAVVNPSGVGSATPFVANGSGVGIDGSLVVSGSMQGTALAVDSQITIRDGGFLKVGNNVLLESAGDSQASKITILPDVFDNAHRAYTTLSEGSINVTYRKDLLDPSKDVRYKSLNRSEFGVAQNGVEAAIPGLFMSRPVVHVFPNNIMSYSGSQPYQSQTWRIAALNIRQDVTNKLKWYFTPQAELVISSSISSQILSLASTSASSPVYSAWADPLGTTNTITGITATFNIRSQHTTAVSGVCKRRMVRYKLQWSLDKVSVAGETAISGWVSLPADLVTATPFTVSKTGLAAGKWAARVYVEYADDASTFGTSTTLEITIGPIGMGLSGATSVTAPRPINQYTPQTASSVLTVQKPSDVTNYENQGYAVYSFSMTVAIRYSWQEVSGNDTGSATCSLGLGKSFGATTSDSGTVQLSAAYTYFPNLSYTLTAMADNGAGGSYPYTTVSSGSPTGTIKMRKTLTSTEATTNELTLTKLDYNLATTTLLDTTGMVSFIAVAAD